MKVLVCGGRGYDDKEKVYSTLDRVHADADGDITIIHGGAKGADTLAGLWAKERKVLYEVYHANWKRDGRGAGILRNIEMLEEGKPDLVIAFPGGIGTADMVRRAKGAKVETREVE